MLIRMHAKNKDVVSIFVLCSIKKHSESYEIAKENFYFTFTRRYQKTNKFNIVT